MKLPATYEQLHLALLTGLLGNIGYKSEEEAHYLGARGIKFNIWPGSSLAKKAGRWIMAELVDTTRLYGRCIAQIQPEWLEKIGGHLLKKSYGEPRWEKRRVRCRRLNARPVWIGGVQPAPDSVWFVSIRSKRVRSLSAKHWWKASSRRAPFFAHNQKLVRKLKIWNTNRAASMCWSMLN
jgi:ATP-dependent helicase HrpA